MADACKFVSKDASCAFTEATYKHTYCTGSSEDRAHCPLWNKKITGIREVRT